MTWLKYDPIFEKLDSRISEAEMRECMKTPNVAQTIYYMSNSWKLVISCYYTSHEFPMYALVICSPGPVRSGE